MTSRAIAAASLAAVLVAGCGSSGSSTSSSSDEWSGTRTGLTGTVRDAKTGAAIGGAKVATSQRSTTTASNGSYTLALSPGQTVVTASASGHATASRTVTISREGMTRLDWSLSPLTASCTYTYSAWGACGADGTQSRTVVSATPSGCTGTPVLTQPCTAPPVAGAGYRVFANNDLGMHCVDSSFAVFSILPPYNVVDAQVVALNASGLPQLLGASTADVRYSAVADTTGSINSTSVGKTDFWSYVAPLYGAALAPGQGLMGMWMPADAPNAAGTTLGWDSALGLFKAPGIPILPWDDAGHANRYPLMRFSAFDKAGTLLASTDVVLPVSDETSCQTCHATGKAAAPAGTLAWSTDPDLEAQARKNVLTLHNARTGTQLQAPVLCATCHYSPALDLAGAGPSTQQAAHRTMSSVMHAFHANKMAGLVDAPVAVGGTVPAATTQACYQCHPGATTQCLRGAMTAQVDCQNCHGNMAAVGGGSPLLAGGSIDGTNDGGARRPWLDLPRCQSCHANDAVTKTVVSGGPPLAADGLRFIDAFRPGDASASPILATNRRFAEETGKLYRKSKGHGGLACEACHGSTHAIWSAGPNDNVAATQLQGHAGTISECSTCHLAAPPNGLGGPHGMHPVGSAWVSAHESQAQSNLSACAACHGTDYRGTVLSRMFSTRTLAGRTLTAGTAIGCYTCHNGPNP
jgi:hypothetical protein